MKRHCFIFLISLLLLSSYYDAQTLMLNRAYYPSRQSNKVLELAQNSTQKLESKVARSLAQSYLFGVTKELSAEQKKHHRILNLKHLFSPSGLHISLFFGLILYFKKSKKGWVKICLFLFFLTLLCFSFALPGLYPLKRSLLFQTLSIGLLFTPSGLKATTFVIFLFVFSLDFLFGSFQEAPLSFIYSFLFWGIIISEKNYIRRLFYLSLAQVLVAYFMQGSVFILAFIFNPILSFIFGIIFAPMVLFLCTPFSFLSEKLLLFFQFLMENSAWIAEIIPAVVPSIFFIYFLIWLLSYQCIALPKKSVFLLLLLTLPLNPHTPNTEGKIFSRAYLRKDENKKGHPKMAFKTKYQKKINSI